MRLFVHRTLTHMKSQLSLSSRTDNNLVHINIIWLLDRERNRTGNRVWRHRERSVGRELGPDLRILHGIREVRLRSTRRNDRYAQLSTSLLAQTLGDGTYSELRASIDRLVRYNAMSSCRSDVDKLPEILPAENRQRSRDAIQNTFDV